MLIKSGHTVQEEPTSRLDNDNCELDNDLFELDSLEDVSTGNDSIENDDDYEPEELNFIEYEDEASNISFD